MIFIDSWIWIEFFAESEKKEKAEKVIRSIEEKGGVLSPTVLMEIRYRLNNKISGAGAERAVSDIKNIDGMDILPVTTEVALYAAEIRQRYYERRVCEISYADAIHIAMAALSGCKKLYSGDPDFREIDEVETEIIQ